MKLKRKTSATVSAKLYEFELSDGRTVFYKEYSGLDKDEADFNDVSLFDKNGFALEPEDAALVHEEIEKFLLQEED